MARTVLEGVGGEIPRQRVADLFGGRAFEHSAAYRNDDFTVAALWLPLGVHPDEERLISWFEKTVAPDKLDRLFSLFEQMARYHPEDPCRHLTFIAVDPARQGKGLGAALLEEGLRQCDRDGIPTNLRVHQSGEPVALQAPRLRTDRTDRGGGRTVALSMLRPPR